MVSIRTGLTLGAIAVAAVIFLGLGGASGIGQRIGSSVGGGLRTFSESLTSSLFQALNPFAKTGGSEPTRPDPTCGAGTVENALGICVPAGTEAPSILPPSLLPSLPEANAEPAPRSDPLFIAADVFSFKNIVSPEFLAQFSFQPPTTGQTLDVTSTLRYLAADGITPSEAAVATLIETNSKLFPEFFG